jgi:hypothetical protein
LFAHLGHGSCFNHSLCAMTGRRFRPLLDRRQNSKAAGGRASRYFFERNCSRDVSVYCAFPSSRNVLGRLHSVNSSNSMSCTCLPSAARNRLNPSYVEQTLIAFCGAVPTDWKRFRAAFEELKMSLKKFGNISRDCAVGDGPMKLKAAEKDLVNDLVFWQ